MLHNQRAAAHPGIYGHRDPKLADRPDEPVVIETDDDGKESITDRVKGACHSLADNVREGVHKVEDKLHIGHHEPHSRDLQ
ncbi:hypothetical protein AAVH_13090 [Aphelenchoides avenae]|nr:hypothetical protein AAVH_13090 [Aphelenchus avenae]